MSSACGSDDDPAPIDTTTGGCEEGGNCVPTTGGDGTTSSASTTTASTMTTTDADTTGGDADGDLPCDVADVVERNCVLCHAAPSGLFGAPMALESHANWIVPAVTRPELTVAQLADMRIEDPVDPMPEGMPMSDADKDVLHAWIAAGTPADPDADCGDSGEDTTDGDTGGVGPDALPCEPTHFFQASAGSGSTDPFHVPAQGADNLYMCFTFQSPFATPTLATAWAPITDDERVLHHWILFRSNTPQPDGGAGPCDMPSDAVFVSGWAPGGENYIMPDDVALELGGPDDYYILQVHYHNTANHADALDASGVAICTTETPRENTAGVLTLGTTSIDIPPATNGVTATGTCPGAITTFLPQPVNVLASFPHMHQLGTSFETVVTRGGQQIPLVDVPNFDFNSQISYDHDPPFAIMPGDTLTTRCTYDNPTGSAVGFGEDTEDEMCFNFAIVYPIQILPEDYRICMID
jgi:hypothetical protein